MDAGLTLEVGKFNYAMREMRDRLVNKTTLQKIIDFEVAKIIEMALKKTDSASVSSIRKSIEDREWATYNGKKYKLSNRFPNAVWAAIVAARKASLTRKLAARGITKQTWLALARQIGFDIEAPGYVRAAKIPNRPSDANVGAKRETSSSGYALVVRNSSPLIPWTRARQAFYAGIVGRRKFYDQNLAHGVFDDLAGVAKKYPGLVVGV